MADQYFTFDQILAADPANPSLITTTGSVTIFAPGDPAMTPLPLETVAGVSLSNPVPVNRNGFGPAFRVRNVDRVAWVGGGLSGFFTSYEGLKNVAVEAADAAVMAKAAAEEALQRVAEGSPDLPLGGTTGQALTKLSNEDHDVGWRTVTGGGGTAPAANMIFLNETQAVPEGTPAGTLIIRTAGGVTTPPPVVTPPPVTDPPPTLGVALAAVPGSAVKAGTLNATFLTMARPVDTVVGDLLVAVFHKQNPGGTFTLPTGWEMLAFKSTETVLRSTMVATHRVTADSPGSWTFTSDLAARGIGTIFRVTGAAASGALATGLSPAAVQSAQTPSAGPFTITARSLVLVVAHAQATTANPWPLPTTIDQTPFTRVVEFGNDEANRATATQSVLIVYAGVFAAGEVPATTLRLGYPVSATAALAVGIRGA